jgi:YVTN family beta-propeller protein
MIKHFFLATSVITLGLACAQSPSLSPSADEQTAARYRLPTGAYLDPAGKSFDLGSMPLSMAVSPDSAHIVVLLNGWREQGIQIVERTTGRVTQTVSLPAVFLGLSFAPDGKSFYVSGGNGDVIYDFAWLGTGASLRDSIVLEARAKGKSGRRYPSGIAVSRDGKTLYAAENLSDSIAVIDIASKRVMQRLATGRYPYAVAIAPDGTVYVSAWGASSVSVFTTAGGRLTPAGELAAPRHPSALLLNRDGSRLFVASGSTDRIAAIDTKSRATIATLSDASPRGPSEGSTPNALAMSADGSRLYVAEADNNAVAVLNLSSRTAGNATQYSADSIAGRIPVGWYPTAVAEISGTLYVLNAKGKGTAPNPGLEQPDRTRAPHSANYTLGQISGTLTVLPIDGDLNAYSSRVAASNDWNASRPGADYPPFKHVVYIIKENRTYDQVFGDLTAADGDSSLAFFPRPVSPNHHALAERFGIFDRFFVNAEVSPDGHNWSTGAYATDYAEKTIPSNYSSRGRSYDYEGRNRGKLVEDDVDEGGSGYLWTLAEKAGISYRNYGEYVDAADFDPNGTSAPSYIATKANLDRHTNHDYPGFSLSVTDQRRADVWLADFRQMIQRGDMPALEIVRLPNDHTAGARAGMHTPRAFMADNDLALGRMVDALSHSAYWKNTVVFVLEDDAQAGPDHVDSHRSPLLVISAYNRGGVSHRFANTTDVLATIEEILGLGSMSQFDHYGRPLREIWNGTADPRPYSALIPAVSLDELNPARGALAEASKNLALSKEDQSDDDFFNRILWAAMKGKQRYPGPTRMANLEAIRSR